MWNCWNWGTGLPFGIGRFFMGFGPFGGLLGLLLLIAVIYLIIRIIRSMTSRPGSMPDRQDSLAILKSRLARGEITREEYQRMREILTN